MILGVEGVICPGVEAVLRIGFSCTYLFSYVFEVLEGALGLLRLRELPDGLTSLVDPYEEDYD